VGLLAEGDDLGEVGVVDVRVNTEEPLEDVLDDPLELGGERHADLGGEDGLVVELVLHPGHQVVDVLWRRDLDRLLELHSI